MTTGTAAAGADGRPRRGRGLPPGPGAPALLQSLRFLRDPQGFLARQQAAFGDAFTLRLTGWGDVVLVSAPDEVRTVFTAPPETLSAGRARWVLDLIYGTRSLLTRDDPEHAWQRRQLMPLFHRDQLARGGRLALDATRAAMTAWPADRPFRLTPHLLSLTTDVLTRLLLGLEQQEARRFERHLHRFIDAAHHPAVFNLPPALTRCGPGPWRRYRRTRDDLDDHVTRLIAERRSRPPAPDGDAIAVLLGADRRGGEPLDDAALRDLVVVLLGSGSETLAYTLAWVVEAVLAHPQVAGRARAELREVTAGGPLTEAHLPRLRYLTAAVTEAMRLYSINPVVPRRVLRPGFTVAGRTLPVGTYVAANGYGAQRRAASYPEPGRFLPERWLDSRPDHYAWMPFGGGARKCVAASFAMHTIPAVMAVLLSNESLRLLTPAVRAGRVVGDMIVPAGGTVVALTPAPARNRTRTCTRTSARPGTAPRARKEPPAGSGSRTGSAGRKGSAGRTAMSSPARRHQEP
ncbi:cytochrome P450 [Streptomyces sp. URMC 127]|uniref:cytochrome P450 n=1 Tax=Streptomyces sp. URMC 127 TaxID=3423402 RepID=UPI003F1E3DA9